MSKPVLVEIDNVRVVRSDALNLAVERLETTKSYNKKKEKWEENTSWQFKGYYSTIAGALKGIVNKELLINENSLTDLKSYLKEVEWANKKIYTALEVIK